MSCYQWGAECSDGKMKVLREGAPTSSLPPTAVDLSSAQQDRAHPHLTHPSIHDRRQQAGLTDRGYACVHQWNGRCGVMVAIARTLARGMILVPGAFIHYG